MNKFHWMAAEHDGVKRHSLDTHSGVSSPTERLFLFSGLIEPQKDLFNL